MLFSALINNFNYGRFVGRAMASVLRQTHADWELLVVDDGSTDDSREVIATFADPRIKKIFQPNGGQGAALVAGIGAASGQYIALLDSDDEWHPEKLEICAAALRERPDCTLLQHCCDVIDENGQRLSSITLPVSGDYDLLQDYRKLRFDLPLSPSSSIVGPTQAFRRLILDPASWRIAADTPVVAGLSVMGGCHVIDRALTHYRLHGRNAEPLNDWWDLIERRRRYYECVNQHLAQVGSKERFHFEDSPVYLRGQIAKTKWHDPAGLWHRLRYLAALMRGRFSKAFASVW